MIEQVEKWALAALVGLVLFLGGYVWGGLAHTCPASDSVPLKQAVAVQKQDQAAAQISQNVAVKAVQAQAQIKTVHDTIIERIPVYVPQSDNRYLVSNGAVSVFNATESGDVSGLSEAPGSAEAEPSTVSQSDLLAAHAADIGYCRGEIAKYDQLWDWAQQQAALAAHSASGGAK